jgi:hypothetical protein
MADNSPMPPIRFGSGKASCSRPGPQTCAFGFMMWNVQYPILSHSAFTTLANLAKNHVAAPCKRR